VALLNIFAHAHTLLQVYRSVLDQQEGEYERELQQVMTKAEAELTVERENTGKLQQVSSTIVSDSSIS
jgi:hypothetical protein